MDEPTNVSTGYSQEYVKELREEAASYRVKARDAETKYNELQTSVNQSNVVNDVNSEFTKRGITADPSWVKMEDGVTASVAVDKFLKDYPQFGTTTQPAQPVIKGQAPISPTTKNTNIPNTVKSELGAVKNDPVARASLREHYRALLANNANTNYTI